MDFSLTPEHEMTRHMVREFAEREVAPILKDYDRAHKPNPTIFSMQFIILLRLTFYALHNASV